MICRNNTRTAWNVSGREVIRAQGFGAIHKELMHSTFQVAIGS